MLYSSVSNLFARGYDFCVYIYTVILRFFCKDFRLHAGSKSYRSPCGDCTATVRTSCDPSGLRFCQSAELNLLSDYLDITTVIVRPCGAVERFPVHRLIVVIVTFSGPFLYFSFLFFFSSSLFFFFFFFFF